VTIDYASDRAQRRLLWTSGPLRRFESRVAARIPLTAHALSGLKLFVVTPLAVLAMRPGGVVPGGPGLVIALVAAFFALDYLDGVVARANDSDSWFGRVFDRATDYPLLIALSWFCASSVPIGLVAVKLAFDVLLFTLYMLGRGTTENRMRMTMSCAALLGLLCLSQGWLGEIVTAEAVTAVLVCNIAFSAIVALCNLDLLDHRAVSG
jgi:phosphatidylglycerophosphate synthase